jgi:hypothetical protein
MTEFKNAEIKILSPTAVLWAESVFSFEYIFDETDKIIHIIDWPKLLEKNPKSEKIEFQDFYRNNKKLCLQYEKYSINIDKKIEEELKRQGIENLKLNIRDGNNDIYLPGSSIKGSLKKNKNTLKTNPESFSITDFYPETQIDISEIKKEQRFYLETGEQTKGKGSITLYIERIKPETIFTGKIKITDDLWNSYKQENLQDIKNILDIKLNKDQNNSFSQMKDFINKKIKEYGDDKKDTILMRLGYGCGKNEEKVKTMIISEGNNLPGFAILKIK